MRPDRIWSDIKRVINQIVQTLDNNVTVQDNFGASGADSGAILTSVGREKKPVWQSGEDFVTAHPELKGEKGDPGIGTPGEPGTPGAPGAPGDDAICADCGTVAEPLIDAITGEMVLAEDDFGDLDVIMVCTEEVC